MATTLPLYDVPGETCCEMCGRKLENEARLEDQIPISPRDALRRLADHATGNPVGVLYLLSCIAANGDHYGKQALIARRLQVSRVAVHKHCRKLAKDIPGLGRILIPLPQRAPK